MLINILHNTGFLNDAMKKMLSMLLVCMMVFTLAACGGILIALDYKVYATMGTMMGLKAFVAAVVGGIGNITGAMLGGFLLGILETFGVALLGIPQGFKDTIAFAVLILILLFKPEGLLGKAEKEKV